MTNPNDDYRKYLSSGRWRHRRRDRLIKAAVCEFEPEDDPGERCTVSHGLEVHHRHYNTLGHEADEDLEVLCGFHHAVRHVLEAACVICHNNVVESEEDAIDIVTAECGGPGDFVWCNPKDLAPGHCSYHDNLLNKVGSE